MSLIKLGHGIVEISGKLAGNIFKSDASGQHVTTTQRRVSKPSSPLQKKQRAWYGDHKRHERWDPGPLIPDEPPKDPYTARVYSLAVIITYRDPSVFEPPASPTPDDPEIKIYAASIIEFMWQPWWGDYGLDKATAAMLWYRYYWLARLTWGVIHEHCVLFATDELLKFLGIMMTVQKMIVPAFWVTLVLAALIYSIGEFFANHVGVMCFNKWNMLLRTSTKLYWAGLQAHPSEKMYTVVIGPEVQIPIYQSYYDIQRTPETNVTLYPNNLFQLLTSSAFWWYTWTFKEIHLSINGDAHLVATNEYRFEGNEYVDWYLNMPVGFDQGPVAALDYLSHLHDLFVPYTP